MHLFCHHHHHAQPVYYYCPPLPAYCHHYPQGLKYAQPQQPQTGVLGATYNGPEHGRG